MPSPCASLPRGPATGWARRGCAPRNNTTGQCKHRRGKPTMRDPEAASSARCCCRCRRRSLWCTPSASSPPLCTLCMCTCTRSRWEDDRTGRADGRADRDRAYASEIALNGRTKALNNAAIISDGRIIDAREPASRLIYFRRIAKGYRGIHDRVSPGNLYTRVRAHAIRARARAAG